MAAELVKENRFILEESSFQNLEHNQLNDLFENFLELLETLSAHSYRPISVQPIYELEVCQNLCIVDLLYGEPSHLDNDLKRALGIAFEKFKSLDLKQNDTLNLNSNCSCPSNTHSPGFSFAIRQALNGAIASCIGLRRPFFAPTGYNICHVSNSQKTVPIFLLANADKYGHYFRFLMEFEEPITKKNFMDYAQQAFQNLEFKPELSKEITHFKQPFKAIRSVLIHHFSVLNDHFRTIYLKHHAEPFPIINEIASLNVDLSPESPNTRKGKDKMKARKINIWGKEVELSWHTKLKRNFDRIYFNPGVKNPIQTNSEEKVIIGIFHEHLKN